MSRYHGHWTRSAPGSSLSSRKSQTPPTSTYTLYRTRRTPRESPLTLYRAISSQLPRLRSQLADLTSQFSSDNTSSTSPTLTSPNNPILSADFAAAQKKTSRQVSKSKNVRFQDNPASNAEDPNRAQLFPYRDDPADGDIPAQDDLSNEQIHVYHSQVIRDQDEQLDRLGASIGRQRELSMQIGDELDGHALLLEDVEEGVDRHAAQFVRARGRLDRFSRKAKENWSLSVILVLIIILVLLIVITK